jgi:hypothetical protein
MFCLPAIKGLVLSVVQVITHRGSVGPVSWARGPKKTSGTHLRSIVKSLGDTWPPPLQPLPPSSFS